MENVLIHLTECDKEFSAKLSTDKISLSKGILDCMYKDKTLAECVLDAFAIYIKDFDDRDGFIKLLLSASDGLDCKKKENKPKEDKKDKKEEESEYERVFFIDKKKSGDNYLSKSSNQSSSTTQIGIFVVEHFVNFAKTGVPTIG